MWASCDPRISIIERRSHVLSLAFELQHFVIFPCFMILTLCSFCSEVFFESSDEKKSLWPRWRCWP